jgi:branched-chain amino acid transport system substrate-binding protein
MNRPTHSGAGGAGAWPAAAAPSRRTRRPGRVSKNEITLGSIQDLSGPIAGFGKQVRMGMLLRVDEVNELGGMQWPQDPC